jgi:hypothetical protein
MFALAGDAKHNTGDRLEIAPAWQQALNLPT